MTRNRLTQVSRKLRRSQTDAEAQLWHHLRNRQLHGFKFRRQTPIGPHIADFLCEQANLIIELDGGQHADHPADTLRTRALETAGYTVLRFWNHDVLTNMEGVFQEIADSLRLATNA